MSAKVEGLSFGVTSNHDSGSPSCIVRVGVTSFGGYSSHVCFHVLILLLCARQYLNWVSYAFLEVLVDPLNAQ